MIDNQDRRTLRRLKQGARDRARKARIKLRTVSAHDDDIATISTMRYEHLVLELGSLLAELRYLGASYEACERANVLVDTVEPDTIGTVIHDIQSQIDDLKSAAERDGIGSRLIDSFDKIEFEDWLS